MKKVFIFCFIFYCSMLSAQWNGATPLTGNCLPILPTNMMQTNQNVMINGGNLYLDNNRRLAFGTTCAAGQGEAIANSMGSPNLPQFGLAFFGNFQERMRMLNDGRFGIGTVDPQRLLHVNGDARITILPTRAPVFDRLVFATTDGDLRSLGMANNNSMFLRSDGQWSTVSLNACGTLNRVPRVVNANGSLDCGIIRDNGTNVGIGVDGTRRLDVDGETRIRTLNTNTTSRIVTADANGVLQAIPAATNPNDVLRGNGTWGQANAWSLTGNSGITVPAFPIGLPIPAGVNYLGTQNTAPLVLATQQLERMRITEGGDVGIGTAAPSGQLANTDINFGELGAGTSTGSFNWNKASSNSSWNAISSNGANGLVVATNGTGGTPLQVSSGAYDINTGNRANKLLTVRGDGRVGVGVIEPVGQLANTDINFGELGAGTSTGSFNWNKISSNSSWNAISSNGANGLVVATNGTGGTPFQVSSGAYNVNTGNRANRLFTVRGNGNVGINNINPLNKLEVTGNFNTQQNANTGNISGLRLTDLDKLNRNLTVAPNATGNVLTVDGDGDVILVKTPNSSVNDAANGLSLNAGVAELGRECGVGATGADLLNSREIPLNNNNIIFSDGWDHPTVKNNNRVGIGNFSGGCNPSAKLDVRRAFVPGKFEFSRVGISSTVSDGGNNHVEKAFAGSANGDNPDNENIGIDLAVDNAWQNTGMRLWVGTNNNNATISQGAEIQAIAETEAMGVFASANASQQATGGSFHAQGSPNNTGILAVAHPSANGTFSAGVHTFINGISGPNDWALFADGRTFTPGGLWTASDINLKKDIEPIENALSTLDKLEPKKYDFDNEKIKYLNLPQSKENYGFIAQELEKVLPSLVKETIVPNRDKESKEVNKIKAVNYTELIPIAISAIKELNAKVEKQNNAVVENEALKSEIASLKSYNEMMKEKFALLEKSLAVLCESGCVGLEKLGAKTTSDVDALYQSIPNPTDDVALINYYLTREYSDAFITVSTQDGKVIQSVKLDPKIGNGSVKLTLGSLANGTYLYTLVASDRVIDTKRLQIVK